MPTRASSLLPRMVQSLWHGLLRSLILFGLIYLTPVIGILTCVLAAWAGASTAGAIWSAIGAFAVALVVLGRPVCQATRSAVSSWTASEIVAAYPPTVRLTQMATGYWWNGYDYQRSRIVSVCVRWIRARVSDPASRRDIRWLVIAPCTVGIATAVPIALIVGGAFGWRYGPGVASASVLVGIALLPWAWRPGVPLAVRLLGPSALLQLATQLASLVQVRADLTQAQEAELQRIERSLHDGAQARLVSIGMTLGTAEHLVDTNPAAAKAMLGQARESSLIALGELRELVHGIVPPVLLERGLVDAVRALALDTPVPTTVHSSLDHCLETPIESALYFATAELITNVVKHAHASLIDINIEYTHSSVAVTVTDDGQGGAHPGDASGLDGIQRRLHAFDGGLHIDSPTGGPTRITAEVPCA